MSLSGMSSKWDALAARACGGDAWGAGAWFDSLGAGAAEPMDSWGLLGASLKREAAMAPPSTEFVALTVRDTQGREITRTMRMTDKLQVLMDFYYTMVNLAPADGKACFLYRGVPVDGGMTPAHYRMMSGAQVDFVLEAQEPSMCIALKVRDRDGNEVTRTMGRTDKLEDLMRFYYSTAPMPTAASAGLAVFEVFRGRRIVRERTPQDHGMEDGDVIELVPFMGGS